jgi:hypothetical protein
VKTLLLLLFAGMPLGAFGQATERIPKHLELARELLQHVPKESNRYTHTDQISFPSDVFSRGYSMNADCSGLVYSLLGRARSESLAQMIKTVGNKKRPLSEDFALSILKERGFQRITRIQDVRPGDIFAWEWVSFLDNKTTGNTGHTMVIDSIPIKIKPRSPFIAQTEQFELWVIDSSDGIWSPDDTRNISKDEKLQGLGRGRFRVYVSAEGSVVGCAKNFKEAKFASLVEEFKPLSQNKARVGFIGRPIY